ncbi:hypothetical protein [Symbioplanes lichenis]|uniref:hypothetical protein n=1 Tax=Symbioplanes lichenis TaxID=1629072 RepID=UPI00273931A4|nr:hypothetical protein [Actinoplanes lichenis]
MSYDLAVWDGDRPPGDEAAGETYESLFDQYLEADGPTPPTARVRAYVSAITKRYPDTEPDSPWSSSPIVDDAAGPIVYLTMSWSRCEEVSAAAAQLAAEHGLVCYDPQMERLRP